VSGNWQDFHSVEGTWNPFDNHIKYWNKFAEVIGCEAGHYNFWSRFYALGQSMAEDDVYAYLRLYVDDPSKGIGAQVRFDFEDVIDDMTFELQLLDGYKLGSTYTCDLEDYAVQLEIKVGLGTPDSLWDYVYSITMYSIDIETGEQEILEKIWTYGNAVIPNKPYFYHNFYIYNGDIPYFREWRVVSSIDDIGILPDISSEDCKVDAKDVGFLGSHWGCEIGEDSYFDDDGYKADMYLDGKVGTKDLSYLASKYGQSW